MIHLKHSLIAGLDALDITPTLVCDKLQKAVELEHATIPVYLYALYSLDRSKNKEIAAIIESVVVEEMLHMTLASNVLNALAGTPVIDHPEFIPTYPGPLPGGVDNGLIVNLAPFSMNQLETFIQIEEPEHPLVFPVRNAALAAHDEPVTIGEFYRKISAAIGRLGDGAFVNLPRNQVGPDLMDESIVVTNVATAQQAIAAIIEQGEGTASSPNEVVGHEVAHYYRFMEIKKGRRLVLDTHVPLGYSYSGAVIPFDPSGVYPVPVNPGLPPGYPIGSIQAFANDNFNYTYTSLLACLHALFNGDASNDRMTQAIALMMSLKGQAKGMMSGIPAPSVHTGPSFQYQPVNPPRP